MIDPDGGLIGQEPFQVMFLGEFLEHGHEDRGTAMAARLLLLLIHTLTVPRTDIFQHRCQAIWETVHKGVL